MKKLYTIGFIVGLNLVFAILLIEKQNKIIKLLYEIQKLQEHKEYLHDEEKYLTFQLHKEQQLSSVHTFAKEELNMKPIGIKEAKTIPRKQHE